MASRRKSKARKAGLSAVTPVGISSRHGRAWWWLALFLGVFPIAFRQVSVSDAWWHVALGRWLVVERTLPDLSKFYFSPFDAGWLAGELRWEWLGDIVFYLCYAAAGAAGLQWLVIGCLMAGLGFLAVLAPAAGLNGSLARFRLFQPGRSRHTGETPVPPVLCKADRALPGPWVLLLLVTVCLGTYQLQLARNSVFSLALYPAVLWLGLRKSGPPTWREYAVIGGVLVLWSCLHGSCVLGWATAFVIFGTRAASAFLNIPGSRDSSHGEAEHTEKNRFRERNSGDAEEGGRKVDFIGWMKRLLSFPNKWTRNIGKMPMPRGIGFQPMIQSARRGEFSPGVRSLLLFFAAFSISLALVVAGRPRAVDFLLLPVRHVVSAVVPKASPAKTVPDSATKSGADATGAGARASQDAAPSGQASSYSNTQGGADAGPGLVDVAPSGLSPDSAIPHTEMLSTLRTAVFGRDAKPFETDAQAPQKAQGLKAWLNSSIWKPDPATPWSNDYWSPLDMLPGMRPIEAAFALAILAAACMVWFRNVPIGLVIAWAGAVFLGLGYVRMFGYTALASGAVILVARSRGVRGNLLVRRFGWAAAGVWIGISWWALFSGQIEKLIPEGQHVSRFGQVPIFDDPACDWVKAEFPKEKAFTTIESGSYCLLRWGFEKPVFLDGFFAPHTREVWDAYHAALNSGDLSGLHDQFGITVAIIPTTSGPWMQRFLHSQDWHPSAIGAGSVVFLHKTIPLQGRSPQIFFTAENLRNTSSYFRMATLREVFLLIGNAEGRDGFSAAQWTAHPSFPSLHELGKEVFPKR
jgi:hypothetical protein